MSAKAAKPLRLYPVILSGGSGSRLWPLSREEYPKQLQALTTERTLLQETALRLGGDGGGYTVAPPIVVCNEAHRFIVAEQLRAAGIEPKAVVIEPQGRNTAPAACVAALLLADEPDALMLIMPSDHSVRNPDAFRAAVARAAALAADGKLVTFGIQPSGPSTAYGYIKRGGALPGDGAFTVERFVEKPDAAKAAGFLKEGGYFWNGGIFLCAARTYLAELAKGEPEIEPAARAAMDAGKSDLFFFRLDAAAFAKVPSQSIDYGVMERTDKAAVVPVDMGWNDVGSWLSLWEIAARSGEGNVVLGDVLLHDARHSYVRSEGPLVAAVGVQDLVIVATPDAVLVCHRGATQDVKKIVDALERDKRHHHLHHPDKP